MPDRLQLTQNTQFYIPRGEITDEAVTAILDAAAENRIEDDDFLVDEHRSIRIIENSDVEYRASVKVFRTKRQVYFFDPEEALYDSIYAFIVILEVDNYLAVLKKSCANVTDAIELNFAQVSNAILSSTFDDDAVDFQKISLRNMTISDRALRARSYEAADLKGLLSTHAAGRSIPYFLKIRQGANLKTISAYSGRVVETSDRKSLDEIAQWVKEQVSLMQNPPGNKGFLNSFAKLVELADVLEVTQPAAILIESSLLHEQLASLGAPLSYTTKKGKQFFLSESKQNRLLAALEIVYEVDDELRIIGFEPTSRLRKNAKSISISSKILQRIKVDENGKELTLQKFIMKNGFYSICFKDPKYMYFMGRCFEDSSGISEIPSILEILIPQASFGAVTSEKGTLDADSTEFTADSMFFQVERLHGADDYVFCDDLGNEWADHITFNKAESCISFIHSKHGDVSKSASNFHDLIGQGIKNLGNMYFQKASLLEKYESKFSLTYNSQTVQSQVNRTRKSDPIALENYVTDLLKDYRLHRKCILACSFLSKEEITIAFNRIRAGENVPGNIIQLLWIISSFAHAAKDMNVIPIIYCKP